MPGALPQESLAKGDSGEEVVAFHGTPPDAHHRARARSAATELGIRNAPPPKKKVGKSAASSKRSPTANGTGAVDIADEDEGGLLAEASFILGEVAPAPKRIAAPRPIDSPRDAKPNLRDADLTEEQLIDSIMDETLR